MKVATLKHSINGRLRLKIHHLKGNTAEAQRILNVLNECPGVINAKVNDLTGSVLIHYNESEINTDVILDYLHQHNVFEKIEHTVEQNKADANKSANYDVKSNEILKTIVVKAVEIMAERAIVALL